MCKTTVMGLSFLTIPLLTFLVQSAGTPFVRQPKGVPSPLNQKKQKLSTKSLTGGRDRRNVRLRRFGKDAGARERRGKVKKLLDRRREIFIKANFAVTDSFAGRRKEFFGKTKKEVDKLPRGA